MSIEPAWFARDCQCVTHDGPHWLHMQLMDRAALKRLAKGAAMTPALAHHIAREAARLEGELAAEMEKRGIDVLHGHLVQRVRDSHEEWIEGLRRKRVAQVAAEKRARRRKRQRDKARLAELAAEYDTATDGRRREIERELPDLQRSWWGPE